MHEWKDYINHWVCEDGRMNSCRFFDGRSDTWTGMEVPWLRKQLIAGVDQLSIPGWVHTH